MLSESQKFKFDDFLLDPREKILRRGDKTVSITPKAFDLLLYLVANHGHLVEKHELINAVWANSFVEEANLPFTIGLLRKALGDSAQEPRFIETVAKRGYRFIGDVNVKTTSAKDAKQILGPTPRPYVLITLTAIFVLSLFAAAFVWFSGEKTRSASQSDNRLTTNGKVTIAAISPDKQNLVFAKKEEAGEGLWRHEMASGRDLQILPPEAVEFVGLSVSPDNAYAYYSVFADNDATLTLRRVPLNGGVSEPLSEIATDVSVTFSPDGKRFAYTESHSSRRETILKTANADGSDPRSLLTLKGEARIFPVFRASPVSWSPDGKVIACAVQETDDTGVFFRILLVDPEDGSEKYLSEQRWNFVEHIAWKDDGDVAILSIEPNAQGTELWLASHVTGEARRVNRGTGVQRWLSAANGNLFSVEANSHASIYIADFPQGFGALQTKQILDEPSVIENLVWAADDKIFYNSWESGKNEIWRVNPDGTQRKQLTSDSHLTQGFTVSPHDGTVVFAAQAKGANSLFVAEPDGGRIRQLTHGPTDSFPRFLNDGKQIVYQQGSLTSLRLARVSLESGKSPQQITGYYAVHPSISPDGTAIAYQFMDFSQEKKRWRVGIMDTGDGRLLNKMDLPFPITERNVVWHPINNFLTMVFTRGGASGFLLLSTGDNSYQTIENAALGKISAFAWSPDGKRLAFVETQETSDVVRIDDGDGR